MSSFTIETKVNSPPCNLGCVDFIEGKCPYSQHNSCEECVESYGISWVQILIDMDIPEYKV